MITHQIISRNIAHDGTIWTKVLYSIDGALITVDIPHTGMQTVESILNRITEVGISEQNKLQIKLNNQNILDQI